MTRTITEDKTLDIYRALDGSTVITGIERRAQFKWAYGGHTDVLLETFDGLMIQGWIQQGEKAEGLCRAWVEQGHFRTWFNETDRLDLREVQP